MTDTPKKLTIIKAQVRAVILVLSLAVLLFGGGTIYYKVQFFNDNVAHIRTHKEAEIRKLIKSEAEQAITFVQHQRSLIDIRLRQQLKQRVDSAIEIADHLVSQYKNKMSRQSLEDLVRESLRQMRFDGGKGYYFAVNLDGTEELLPIKPYLEGQKQFKVLDAKGVPVTQNMIDLINAKGHGFVTYRWVQPGDDTGEHLKMSYIKYFEPFDWFIGTGKYIEDEERDIQREVLDYLETIRFGNGGYLFGGTWNGDVVLGPGNGNNALDLRDRDGKALVAEFIAAARDGGGYVAYTMPAGLGKEIEPKIAYAMAIPEWKWFIGAGIYLNEIDELVEIEREHLIENIRVEAMVLVLIIVLIIFLSFVLSWQANRRISRDAEAFRRFFHDMATRSDLNVQIDPDAMMFAEFSDLAKSANKMLVDRTQKERALRDSDLQFRLAIDSMEDALWVTDRLFNVTVANESAIKLARWSGIDGEILGHKIYHMMPVCNADENLRYRQVVESGEALIDDVEGKVKGELTTFCISRFPVFDGDHVSGVLTIVRDLTEQVEASRQAEHLQRQLQQSQKMEAVGQLAGGIAHDFNNLLTGIIGHMEMARMDVERGSDLDKNLLEVLNASQRTGDLVRQLLAFGRKQVLRPTLVDLAQLVEQFRSMLARLIGENIILETDFSTDPCVVHADRSQIEQVLVNLVVNARDAMVAGGVLTIKTSLRRVSVDDSGVERDVLPGNYACLSVSDTGVGMDDETRMRIFEPFFSTKDRFKGSGLGLATIHGIVYQHKGFIEVDSQLDEGTTFTICFPLHKDFH